MQLHPLLVPFEPWLGTWVGEGHGTYPTIEPFDYRETTTFTHVGKPFMAYTQRTVAADDGRPLHSESGYWRALGEGHVELVIAHPFGAVEVYEGAWQGGLLCVRTLSVATTPTAKRIDSATRTFTLDGDTLRYDVAMAAVGVELTHHLSAELHRQR